MKAMRHNKPKAICLFLVSLLLGQHCSAVSKQWLPSTNWENSGNWNKGRVPCKNDDVHLGKQNFSLSVALGSIQSVKSLALPKTGELILFGDAEVIFTAGQEDASSCEDAGDIHFVATAHDWFNPYNWKEMNSKKGETRSSSDVISILHMNNVPCVHDTAVFPRQSSFMVKSDKQITVATIYLSGQEQTSKSFKDYYSSDSGMLQFNFTDATDLTAEQCSDLTGCACGYLKFSKTICSHVDCSNPACKDAIQPEGSCCEMCGAVLEVTVDKGFQLEKFKDLLLDVAQKEYKEVNFAVSKTEKGSVQLVLGDQGNGERAHIAAEYFKDKIVSEKQFNVVSSKIVQQSSLHSPTKSSQKGNGNRTVIPLAMGITLLALFLIAVLFLIFRRTKRIRSHSLPIILDDGFNLELDEIEKTGEDHVTEQMDKDGRNNFTENIELGGTENPLYESAESQKEKHNRLQ